MGMLYKKRSSTADDLVDELGTIKNSFEDAESLLNLILLLTAFMMAFTVSMTTSYSHGDLLAADAMHMQFQKAKQGIAADEERLPRPAWAHVPSYFFANRGAWANLCYFTALALGVGCYISLSFSDCREDPDFFQTWFKLHWFAILAAFFCFIAGTFVFFSQLVAAAEITFPRYAKYANKGLFDHQNKVMIETYYNEKEAGVIQSLINRYGAATQILIVVGILLPIICTFWAHHQHQKHKQASSETQVHAADPEAEPQAPAHVRHQHVLERAGMDFETMVAIDDTMTLAMELEKAGIAKPGDRLKIIAAVRRKSGFGSQTLVTEFE